MRQNRLPTPYTYPGSNPLPGTSGGHGLRYGRARPATTLIAAFTEQGRRGVEPICRVFTAHGTKIAEATYYAHNGRPRHGDLAP